MSFLTIIFSLGWFWCDIIVDQRRFVNGKGKKVLVSYQWYIFNVARHPTGLYFYSFGRFCFFSHSFSCVRETGPTRFSTTPLKSNQDPAVARHPKLVVVLLFIFCGPRDVPVGWPRCCHDEWKYGDKARIRNAFFLSSFKFIFIAFDKEVAEKWGQ